MPSGLHEEPQTSGNFTGHLQPAHCRSASTSFRSRESAAAPANSRSSDGSGASGSPASATSTARSNALQSVFSSGIPNPLKVRVDADMLRNVTRSARESLGFFLRSASAGSRSAARPALSLKRGRAPSQRRPIGPRVRLECAFRLWTYGFPPRDPGASRTAGRRRTPIRSNLLSMQPATKGGKREAWLTCFRCLCPR